MFNKDWFLKHQKQLLKFANTEAGKYLLDAKDEQVIKLFPNGYTVFEGTHNKKNWFISRFYTHDKVAKILVPILTRIEIAEEYERTNNKYEAFLHYSGLELKNYKYPTIYLTIDTFTANGGGQGRVYAQNAVYATAHDATTGTAKDNATTRPGNTLAAGDYYVTHGYAPFDSSSIPDANDIVLGSNTFVRAVGAGAGSTADSDSVSLVASTQAGNTALVTDDFEQVGSTKLANDLAMGSWSAAGNNDFQLNSNGIANISKTGYSKFAWRTAKDIANTAPTGNNTVDMVDNTNLLSVEHTLPIPGIYTII